MKKTGTMGERLAKGLREAIAFQRGEAGVKLRVTEIEVPDRPPNYSSGDVQHIRENVLHLSQAAFARLLNVSPKTVQSWEQGTRQPAPSAARLLQFIERPQLFIEQVAGGIQVAPGGKRPKVAK